MPKPNGKKPAKPYKDFPLFAHSRGYWAKKINGRQHSFGPWEDPDGALQRYLREKDDLYAGRRPTPSPDGIRLWQLCDAFLESKKRLLDASELSARSMQDYLKTVDRLLAGVGQEQIVPRIQPADLERYREQLSKTLGPVSLSNELGRIRTVFGYGYKNGLLDAPVRAGTALDKPSAKALRLARAEKGPRLLTAEQARAVLEASRDNVRAMVYLGLNCGLGNADVGRLEWQHIRGEWLDFPRPKTGVPRRAWLWPETRESLQAILPDDGEGKGLVFVTKRGAAWHRDESRHNPLTLAFRRVLKAVGHYRPGLSFYALRHTFATVAGATKDQIAVDHVMGHAPPPRDMRATYREAIEDDRLKAVCEHVRAWLLAGVPHTSEGRKPGSGSGRKAAISREK